MPELKDLFVDKIVKMDGVVYSLRRLMHGEASEAFTKYTKFDVKTGQIDIDADGLALKRLARCIADWNLTKDGKKLPINEETVKQLPEDHTGKLLEFIRGRGIVNPELEKK